MNNAQLIEDYREAVRLYVWYSESKFSFFQGKDSKELADRYRNLAHDLYERWLKAS